MRELVYEIEFLSDIVLPATSNTEGNIEQLDFIAGSNFLGMVAKNYAKFENSFNIFHSGAVKFGDATLLKDAKRTYKMPLSFFHEKADDKTLYNHHTIEDFSKFTQLKQKRNGYITQDLEVFYIDYNYSQKSAYDKDKRRSKDSSMFGYSAMKKGLKWLFSIRVDDNKISPKDFELLKESIKGTKRLGKSKSAQYGLVEIRTSNIALSTPKVQMQDNTILYLNSRIALVDESGNPTYDLTYLFNGLKDENIEYSKCQLKTSTFTPYNGARQTKDYERVCINKGSVIVLNNVKIEDIPHFVGAYQSEGFGQILVNPSFLSQEKFSFIELKNKKDNAEKQVIKSDLSKFLKQRENTKQEKLDILNRVDDFIGTNKSLYKKIKPSQWGKIRSICTSGEADFKDEIREYISHGVKEWDNKQIETLLQDNYSLEFIKLISIQMPKIKKAGDNKDEN